ncbi:MAG TPA: type II secretion system major pseudopilin GspG [Pseudomonadales bacterium]|nr:type II secretion system major pseudopilin GspG [Pseudomonadales bacterium]
MQLANTQKRRQAGFSLIEILVVMVIIGILVSLVAPSVLNRVDDARLQKVEADFKAIESALSIYHLDNFTYPSTDQGLQALVNKPDGQPEARNWKKGGYLKEMPLDPWGREYLYLSPGENGREFDLYTLGADGVSGGEDQNADMFSGETPNS